MEEEKKDLQKLLGKYIDEARFSGGLRPRTLHGVSYTFELFLRIMPEVNGRNSLTEEMLNEFFKRIRTRPRKVGKDKWKTGVENTTIKTYWSKLNVFFVWLFNKNYIPENPLKNIKPPKVSYDDYRRLDDHEINKIYSAVTLNSVSPFVERRDTLIISILCFCGLRKGELAALKVTDIDLINKELTVRGATSKSKVTRVLHMHDTLILHLRNYLKERNILKLKTEYLIASSRGDIGLTHEGLNHWVKSLIKKSGVKFHLHRFRHTFACKLVEANVNIFKIQIMLGHARISMTVKYLRSLKTQDMGADIDKISF